MSSELQGKITAINQRTKELNSLYHIAAVRSGISDGEVGIWSLLLGSEEEYSQRDIALLLSLPVQTVNSIVSNMVKKGFIFLDHSPGSRNRKTIHVTAKGMRFADQNVRWIFDAEQKAIAQTESEDIDRLIELMDDYISCLKEELQLSD